MSEIENELYEFWEKNVSEVNNFRLQGENSRTIKWLIQQTMQALSQPLPFDVLAHLRDGGKICNDRNDGYYFFDPQEQLCFFNAEDQEVSVTIIRARVLIDHINWQPYTEPQLEDGLYFVEEVFDGRELKTPYFLGYNKKYECRGWFTGTTDKPCDIWDIKRLRPQTNPATNLPWKIETPEDKS